VEDSTTDNVAGVTHTLSVTSPGAIRRLSVALLLDESDEALLAKQEDLGETVKSAIGFVESRGDQFSVRAVPFLPSEASPLEPGGFQITDLLPLVKYLAEAIVVLFVLIVLKKAWSGGKSSPKQATEQAQETEAKEEDEDIRQRLARVVDEEPERAREVLLKWLREEIAT
jgi:flagellar biosynthesis/type III secretory pathway M-ring protein FliF/YscJ